MRKFMRDALTALLLTGAVLSCSACTAGNSAAFSEYHYTGMGETITILLSDTDSADMAARECAREIAAHGNALSADYTAGDVYAINGEINHFMTEDKTLMQVLTIAESITEITGGAYDCTYGALTSLWDFGSGTVPSADAVADALSHSGRDKFTVSGKTITKNDTAAQLDFSRLAPGMAAQKAVESLYEAGIPYGIVSIGENCGVFGQKPDGETFKIGLRDPRDTDSVFGYLCISSGFVSSAGDYQDVFTAEGQKFHSVLDPKTGYPASTGLDSVTVYAANGAAANALSYALFTMGLDDALALYESDPAVLFEAVFVTDSGEVVITDGLRDMFELNGEKYLLRNPDPAE